MSYASLFTGAKLTTGTSESVPAHNSTTTKNKNKNKAKTVRFSLGHTSRIDQLKNNRMKDSIAMQIAEANRSKSHKIPVVAPTAPVVVPTPEKKAMRKAKIAQMRACPIEVNDKTSDSTFDSNCLACGNPKNITNEPVYEDPTCKNCDFDINSAVPLPTYDDFYTGETLEEEGSRILHDFQAKDEHNLEQLYIALVNFYYAIQDELPEIDFDQFADIEMEHDNWYAPGSHIFGTFTTLLGGNYGNDIYMCEPDEPDIIDPCNWWPYIQGPQLVF